MSSILRQNFYVDNLLNSFASANIAAGMIHKVKLLCNEGGFNPAKFSTNVEVLKSTPDEYREDGVKDKDLNLWILLGKKSLGVKWNNKGDTLGFIIKMDDKPVSWHGLLAALSRKEGVTFLRGGWGGCGCNFYIKK